MAVSRGSAPQRPVARPLPGATWQAHVLDAAVVQGELDRLWRRVDGGAAVATAATGSAEAGAGPKAITVQMRATTFNLIAVARRTADAARVEDAILHLGDLYPSRATILVAAPVGGRGSAAGLDVRVALLEQAATKDRPAVRFECVTVEASAEDDRHLASIASPLLVADLPDFLWWPSDGFVGSELFDDLTGVTDRLIVDTSVLPDPGVGLRFLAELVTGAKGCPNLSDFAWARLAPWRRLVAQFFDPPAAQPSLETLSEVVISYGGADGGTSGATAGLLMAGWLATRLGWRAPGELVAATDGPGGWRATLRAGARGHLREVVLIVRPTRDPIAARCLGAVELTSTGAHPGTFRVERVDTLGLSTRSETASMPPVRRMVYATSPNDAGLLADDLRVFGRDRVYEESLAFAAGLAPSDADGTTVS